MTARVILVSEAATLRDRFATVLREAPDIDLVDLVACGRGGSASGTGPSAGCRGRGSRPVVRSRFR